MPKKKSDEPFLMLFREVNNSYAWRAASGACHKAIFRIAEENMAHGGVMNGRLKVSYADIFKYGVRHHDSIPPALREGCALGLIVQTKRGRAGNAEHRASHEWAITFIKDKKGKYIDTRWRRFRSLKEAKKVGKKARAQKDTEAVKTGTKRAAIGRKVVHFPVPESGTETSPGIRDRKRTVVG
jgi:hypothetical protein